MADNFTPRLNLTKIEVGASEDTWGEKLNDNSDTIDSHFDTGPALKITSGGTGAVDAAAARTNLGLDTLATQAANDVAIIGGTLDGVSFVRMTAANPSVMWGETDASVGNKNWQMQSVGGVMVLRLYDDAWSSFVNGFLISRSGNSLTTFNINGTIQSSGNVVWHAGNDGAGSTLDADLLDGQQGAFYTSSTNQTSGTLPVARLPANVLRNQGAFTGGEVTISASAPSGTPAPGDLWLQYV